MARSLLLVLTLLPSMAFAWGFAGHRRLASKMQDALPANHCLRAWFTSKQTFTLQDSACDPDRWRSTDSNEGPRHYLNIDWVNPVTNYPRDYQQAEQQLGPSNARNNGTVPWRVEAKYHELVAAFRSGNESTVLETAFVLSHYVFDSLSILHNTRDYDPNGLHERWESEMLENTTRINAITTGATAYYGTAGFADPRYNVFDLVIVGNGLVAQLIAADNAANADVVLLYDSTRDMTARRWGDGITLMSSILWTAWNEAGRPNLSGFSASCSRAGPAGEVVVIGYPPAGGFTHGPDAGIPMVDAGVEDAGSEFDAGVVDAGSPDAGGIDAGDDDAGISDAGSEVDAGFVDSGTGGGGGGSNGGHGNIPGGNIFGGGLGGGGGRADEGLGCVCTNVPGASLALLVGFIALLRRRR